MDQEDFKVVQGQGKYKTKEEEEKEEDLQKNRFLTIPMFEPQRIDQKKRVISQQFFLNAKKHKKNGKIAHILPNNTPIKAGSSGKYHFSTKYFTKNNLYA